jgi:hypothetical protein
MIPDDRHVDSNRFRLLQQGPGLLPHRPAAPRVFELASEVILDAMASLLSLYRPTARTFESHIANIRQSKPLRGTCPAVHAISAVDMHAIDLARPLWSFLGHFAVGDVE